MIVDYAVLCDSCSAEAGRHFIHGGGWDAVFTDSLPVEYPQIGVAVRLLIDGEERSRSWDLELDVVGPDEASVLPGPVRGHLVPAGSGGAHPERLTAECVAFRAVYLRLERPGPYAAVLRIDGREERRIPFWVVEVDSVPGQTAQTPRTTSSRSGGDRWLWSGAEQGDESWLWRPDSQGRVP